MAAKNFSDQIPKERRNKLWTEVKKERKTKRPDFYKFEKYVGREFDIQKYMQEIN